MNKFKSKILLLLSLLVPCAAFAQVTITNVFVSASTATTATIEWTTSGPSTSQVLYGNDPSLPFASPVDHNMVTAHKVTLIVLDATRPYDFAAVSVDGGGLRTQSSTQIFALCGAPFNPVSGTINNYYQYGSFTLDWVPPAGSSTTPTVCGQAMSTHLAGSISGGGSLSSQVADAYKVIPGPGTWRLVATDVGNLAPITVTYPISAQSNDLSPQLQAAAPAAGLTAVIANLNDETVYPPFICTTSNGACGGGGGNPFVTASALVVNLTTSTSRNAILTDITKFWTISGTGCGTGTNFMQVNGNCGVGGLLPQGPGTNQFSNAAGNAFISGGILDTDAYGNAVAAQTAKCAGLPCSLYTSPTSSNNEMGRPLASLGANISNFWESYRYNSNDRFFNSPIPQANASTHYPLIAPSQTAMTEVVGYPMPFPPNYGYSEGSSQNGLIQIVGCTTGYSNGPAERDISPGLFAPLPGYPDAAAWAGCSGQLYIFNKNEAGIGQAQTFFLNCVGIGDCQGQAWFVEYAGGGMSDSDELLHAWGSMHLSTPGNTLGVVDFVGDPGAATGLMKFHANITVEAGMQGQLRYVIGDAAMSLNADKITASSGNTPPGVVFNDGTFTPSTARGVVATHDCDVPAQLEGVGIGNNSGTPGCDILVDPSFGIGHFVGLNDTSTPGPMCGAFHVGGLYDVGMVPISTTAITGNHQTIQMSMRRSLPVGSVVYQGGVPGCTWGLDWTGDRSQARNYHQNFVDGTVLPIIGTTDVHTVLVPTYFDSGTDYAFTLYPSSHAGTRAVATGPSSTTGQQPLAVTGSMSRTSNKVTVLLDPSNLPLNMWLGQVFLTVSGCTQTDFNGVKASPPTNQVKMPGPELNKFTYNDPGADGTCPAAKFVPQGTVVEFRPLAEILNVSNRATDGSVEADQSVDGTLWTTYQSTLATIGNNITIPPNYAAALDMINLNAQSAQPLLQNLPISILVSANSGQSGFGGGNHAGIALSNIQHPEDMAGTGGNVPPSDAFHIFGPFPFRNLLVSDFAPSPFGGSVISIGPAYGFYYPKTDVNSSFRTYPILCLSGDDQQFCTNYMLHEIDTNTISFGFNHSQRDQIQFNDHLSQFLIPTGFNNLQIETNIGGVFGGNFIPTSGIGQCTTFEPNGLFAGPIACYRRVTSNLGTATPTSPGAPVTNRVIYVMIGDDTDGLFASPEYVESFSPSPITSTFSNTITCKDLPPGVTGAKIYLLQPGIDILPVTGGNCNAPTDVVIDTGAYDTPKGPNPWIAGFPLYSGGFYGNTFCLLDADPFGTSSDVCTAFLTQRAPGVWVFSDGTKDDGLGMVIAQIFGSGNAANTDQVGELTFAAATTATYTFTRTYGSHPVCVPSPEATTAGIGVPWVIYTGVVSFTINFPAAFTGNVGYECHARN